MNRRRFTQQLAAAVGAMSLGRTDARRRDVRSRQRLRVDGERINRQLLELAQFGKNPYGGVSRVAYSEFDRQGREWAMNVMREAGLAVSIDAAGNIFGRRPGSVADAQAARVRVAHRLGARRRQLRRRRRVAQRDRGRAHAGGEQPRDQASAGGGHLPERGRRHGRQPRARRRADRGRSAPQDAAAARRSAMASRSSAATCRSSRR